MALDYEDAMSRLDRGLFFHLTFTSFKRIIKHRHKYIVGIKTGNNKGKA
jgi:hypothetical protein